MIKYNVLLSGGPEDGRLKIISGNVAENGGFTYNSNDKPGADGWYGVVMTRDRKPLVDNQGFLILVWCGWDGEGIE